MKLSRSLKGSLMIELLVVCGVIALCLPVLVLAVARMQERQALAQAYQNQLAMKAAIEAHFTSQWARLVPANCAVDDALFLTIESGMSPPIRLAARLVDKESDWVRGTDYGLCRGSENIVANPHETEMDCHWKAGDIAAFSSCAGRFEGQVLDSSVHKSTIIFDQDSLIGQSGILESEDGFYWYVSEGKDGWNALWRTPYGSGNSLELWNGIERIAVFPLLDDTHNGLVDSLDVKYGDFALNELRGLWVEYQYRLTDCNDDYDRSFQQTYRSMRGETWTYYAPCEGVGNQIIVL